MVSRREVAEKAGVSVAAVSYVLNDKPGVSHATRQRVLAAIADLGYSPHYAARLLKTRKTQNLAVFVNYLGDPFEAGLLNHLEQRAQLLDYTIQFQTYYSIDEAAFNRLFPGRIDGLLLLGQSLTGKRWNKLREAGIPVVSVMQPVVSSTGADVRVDVDWQDGMHRIIGHLLGQGYRRIGLMGNGDPNHHHERRAQSFIQALDDFGLKLKKEDILLGRGRLEDAQRAMDEYLQAGFGDRQTAFVAMSDLMAVGMLTACREAGIQVPDQMAVCGCENILMTLQTTPAVTVLDVPRLELAYQAVDTLIQCLSGENPGHTFIQVPLIPRGSTMGSGSPLA